MSTPDINTKENDMAKHQIKGFVTYREDDWDDAPQIGFLEYDPRRFENDSRVVVGEHEFEVEVPDDFDPRQQQVDKLKAQQQKARADFEALCTDIQRQINELQALELAA